MNVLIIGLDKRVLNKNSATFKRLKDYSQLVDKIHVVVFGFRKKIKSGKLFIYGSGGKSKIHKFFEAYKQAKRILKNKNLGNWLIVARDPFFCGLVGYLLKRKFGVKLHIQLHGDFFSSRHFRRESLYNRFLYFLGRFIAKKADSFRVVSQRIKKSLDRLGIDEKKITVVPIYTEIKPKTQNPRARTDNKFIFLTVGRLVPVKNISLQIEALVETVKKCPSTELWIVGSGPERKKLERLVKKIRLKNRIKFWGWQDDLEKLYKQADVFLLTSNYEGWGLVVIEAASFSLPIIMTDVGCAREVIESKKSGIIIPVNNKKSLEKAMPILIKDKNLRKKLGEGAKQALLKLPNKEETLELYKKSWQKAVKK